MGFDLGQKGFMRGNLIIILVAVLHPDGDTHCLLRKPTRGCQDAFISAQGILCDQDVPDGQRAFRVSAGTTHVPDLMNGKMLEQCRCGDGSVDLAQAESRQKQGQVGVATKRQDFTTKSMTLRQVQQFCQRSQLFGHSRQNGHIDATAQ